MPRQILSISYDETLLQTRQLMLERSGYEVTSSFGFTASLAQCMRSIWDLLIMGHSIPISDKRALLEEFRKHNQVPVLALQRLGEAQLPGAEHSLNPEHPEELLATVEKILNSNRRGASF